MSSVTDAIRTQFVSSPGSGRWCVALSGGLDSTVLLDALSRLRTEVDGLALRAVHVDHGLHAASGTWAAHCRVLARRVDVSLEVRRVEVDLSRGEGIEAAARRARYAAFESLLAPGETLATAHHQDDQAETVLLRLLRGAGARGLGGIPVHSAFGPGRLVRPLLALPRSELEAYARSRGLTWIDDPTNRDTARDRNFLRHEIMPVLRRRWRVAGAAIGRSARLATEAAGLLDALGEQDLQTVAVDGLLDVDALRRLEPARQRNLLRHVLRQQGFPPPSETQLLCGLGQLLSARADRNPVWHWPGGQMRRYRGRLYLLEHDPEAAADRLPDAYQWDGHEPLELGPVRGRLRLERADQERRSAAALTVSFRRGGERMLEADRRHHKRLKKMFQAGGIVPWMREHVPLLSHRGELIAVADLWASAELASCIGPSARIVWDRHAAIR